MNSRLESYSHDVPPEVFASSSVESQLDDERYVSLSTTLAIANFIGIVVLVFVLLALSGCAGSSEPNVEKLAKSDTGLNELGYDSPTATIYSPISHR